MALRRSSKVVRLEPRAAARRADDVEPPALAARVPLAEELLLDAQGCDAAALTSVERMQRLCAALVEVLGVRVLGAPVLHVFPPTEHGAGGLTALYLLSESHLALHTWPERQALLLSVCCCRPLPADEVVFPLLRSHAGARAVRGRRLERGVP